MSGIFLAYYSFIFLALTLAGTGEGGAINIDASGSVVIEGFTFVDEFSGEETFFLSGIDSTVATPDAIGNAGDIEINATNILLSRGRISTSTIGNGDAGNIKIETSNSINVDNQGFISSASENFGQITSIGNAGNIDITTKNLSVTNRGNINSSLFLEGVRDGGNITINASDSITLSGSMVQDEFSSDLIEERSGLFTLVDVVFSGEFTTGNAGNLTINTGNLVIEDGARISSETSGDGNAGNATLNVDRLTLRSGGQIRASSLLGNGNAGNIEIISGENINIDGNNVANNDETSLFSTSNSGIFSQVELGSTGNGGDIAITTSNLNLTNQGEISASTEGLGNAGDINISANNINLLENSEINVSAFGQGDGGNIFIQANGLNLNRGRIFAVNQPSEVNTSANIDPVGGNVNLELTNDLILRNNSSISARAFQEANGGNLNIDARFIIAFPDGNNDILASSQDGRGGNISIDAQSLFGIQERFPSNSTNDINASSQVSGLDGTVNITTPDINPVQGATELPTNVVVPEETTQQACRANREIAAKNSFSIEGQGGIIPEPGLPLNSSNIYVNGETDSTSTIPAPIETAQGKIQPARGIKVVEDGTIILTAYPTNNSGERLPYKAIDCS